MPVFEYLSSIPKEERAIVFATLDSIKNHGLSGSPVDFRHIEEKLWEIRIGPNRIFYVVLEQNLMVLLHAYKKQSQKLPVKERKLAMERMKRLMK